MRVTRVEAPVCGHREHPGRVRRGWCNACYLRGLRDETLERLVPRGVPSWRAFWERVDRSAGARGHWWWLGKVDSHGSPEFKHGGVIRSARRFAYEQTNGPLPGHVVVASACGEPSCVNPRHAEERVRRRPGRGGR